MKWWMRFGIGVIIYVATGITMEAGLGIEEPWVYAMVFYFLGFLVGGVSSKVEEESS